MDFRGVWLGPVAWTLALVGTLRLQDAGDRLFSVVMIGVADVLSIVAWGEQCPKRTPVAIIQSASISRLYRQNPWRVEGVVLSALAVFAADIRFMRNPAEAFGLAGVLWLLAMIAVVIATMLWPGFDVLQDDWMIIGARSGAHGRDRGPPRC
jgi:hypothetical protein